MAGSDCRFCDVSIDHVILLWPQVRPYIVKALDREGSGRFLPRDVLRNLLEGKARLWVSWNPDERIAEAAVVTEIAQYPQKRELRIWLIGGRNLRAWIEEAKATIEAFARAQGCHFLTGALREGWLRIGGEGWKQTGVMIEKAL